jgi:hypothetical protein
VRFLSPLILICAVIACGLGTRSAIDVHHTADRAPASVKKTYPALEPEEASLRPSDPSREPASEPPREVRAIWPKDGERWIYRFERKASAAFAGKSWLNLKIGGRTAVEAVESAAGVAHGENLFYLLSFEVDRLEMQGQSVSESRHFPSVRLEVDAAGKVRELRFVRSRAGNAVVTEEESDLVRDLTSQWLFFENRSRLGIAEVEWADVGAHGATPGKRTVTKHVLRYADQPEISKLDSNHEWSAGAQLDSGLKVDRIDGNENFTLASANGDFTQATSYRWVWISTEKPEKTPEILVAEAFTLEGAPASRNEEQKPKIDPARIAREWSSLKALPPHARLKLFRDAKRALDSGANELVSLIVGELRGKSQMSVEWRTGVGALASSSNPEAAKALLALFKEPGRTIDEKLSILSGVASGEGMAAPEWKETFEATLDRAPANAVTTQTPPSTSAEVATFDPARDYDVEGAIREASLYALGSSIRKETNRERRRDLELILWREVKDARSESAQLAVLDAIGNSGSGAYSSYLQDQFTSGTPLVRAKAVAAVRFLESDLAKPILDRAKGDPVPEVRKAAAWSAKFQAAPAPDAEE